MKGFENAFISGRKEVPVNHNGETVIFYANEIGYLDSVNISTKAVNQGLNGLALLVSESIVSSDGDKFTYDEILKLKKEYAKPFFDAVLEIHSLGEDEKK